MKRFRSRSLAVVALLLGAGALGAAGCSGRADSHASSAEHASGHEGELASVSLHIEGMT